MLIFPKTKSSFTPAKKLISNNCVNSCNLNKQQNTKKNRTVGRSVVPFPPLSAV